MVFDDKKKLQLMVYFPRSSFTLCSLPLLAAGICNDFSFVCKDKQCVNKVNAECDRENDCSDGSDEQGCGKSHCLMYFFSLTNKSEEALLVWTKHGQEPFNTQSYSIFITSLLICSGDI